MADIQVIDGSVNLLRAILWQYSHADRLKALVQAQQDWHNENVEQFWIDWYRDVFNMDTANDFGLAIWGRILGIPITVDIEPSTGRAVWGFGTNNLNFNRGNFGRKSTGSAALTNAQRRLLLKMRYFQLTQKPTVTNVNKMLFDLFNADYGTIFVVDPLDMGEIVYFHNFALPASLKTIFTDFDVLPRPAAVGVRTQLQVRDSWGFGVNHLNFNRGNFGRL